MTCKSQVLRGGSLLQLCMICGAASFQRASTGAGDSLSAVSCDYIILSFPAQGCSRMFHFSLFFYKSICFRFAFFQPVDTTRSVTHMDSCVSPLRQGIKSKPFEVCRVLKYFRRESVSFRHWKFRKYRSRELWIVPSRDNDIGLRCFIKTASLCPPCSLP